ncbi:MAG TPA: hypothetical protein VHT02_05345 [Methylocella sp.]|nr:hypothetical protein [Methylocella sp.]
MTRPGPTKRTQDMKIRLEQLLNLVAAAVNLAAAVGLDPAVAMLLLAAISVGLAVAAGIPR